MNFEISIEPDFFAHEIEPLLQVLELDNEIQFLIENVSINTMRAVFFLRQIGAFMEPIVVFKDNAVSKQGSVLGKVNIAV